MKRLLLALAFVLTGCRAHLLDDGPYTLTIADVIRDDCGLATAQGIPGTGTLRTTGHLAYFEASLFSQRLVGTYQRDVERLALDGTAQQVTLGACRFDTAALKLELTTKSATTFAGTYSLSTKATMKDSCSCELWLRVDGRR